MIVVFQYVRARQGYYHQHCIIRRYPIASAKASSKEIQEQSLKRKKKKEEKGRTSGKWSF